MTDSLVFSINCPQCNFSNSATAPNVKYKEIVYQLCDDNEGQQDHNIRDQIKCDNCHKDFDFYWCAGHTIIEGHGELKRLDRNVKWPQT